MIEPWSWDSALLLALNFDGGGVLDTVMYFVSKTWVWIPLYAFLMWMVWRKADWRTLLVFVGVAALTVFFVETTCNYFKYNVSKFRPTHTAEIAMQVHTVRGYVGGLYGTVSAHAANCMAFAVIAGGFLARRWVWWMLAGWVILVAYSRIYLGVHFPADILFGLITGTVWGSVSLMVLRFTHRWVAHDLEVNKSIKTK